MKKISAVIMALIMTCAAFTACGDNDSDSKKDSDKKSSSSAAAADDKDSDSKADDSKVEEGGLAKAYSEKLKGGEFVFDMTLSTDMTGEMPCKISSKGKNYHVTMTAMGVNMDIYTVDGKTYTLMPDAKLYQVAEGEDMEDVGVDVDEFILSDDYKYVETKEEDGMTVEVFTAPAMDIEVESGVELEVGDDDDSANNTVSYYFDADQNLKKIVTESSISGNSTVTVNSLAYECEDIVLPDLTGWTESKEGEELDEETQMKLSLSMLGVTEDMVTDAGYTYAQLAEMEDEELMSALEKMGVDLGELMGE